MKTFKADYLRKKASAIFRACGASAREADIVAEILVSSNLMGLDSHGIIRIPQYVRCVEEGKILPGAAITIRQETSTTAIVDVGWNFGQVGALRATEVAVEKAKKNGLGCTVAHRCNHVGRVGAYPQMAAEQDLIGLAACGSAESHWVSPWGGREGRLATNPLAFAAPTNGNPVIMDISTSVASEGKIRLQRNRGEQLPEGWILDAQGRPSTDPHDFYGPPMGVILPFGDRVGYKGFALSLMAQIMSSVLSGAGWKSGSPKARDNNFWFMAIDISAFVTPDEFRQEMDGLARYLKSAALAPGFDQIPLPGELDFQERERRKIKGIPVEEETWRQIEGIAKKLGLKL